LPPGWHLASAAIKGPLYGTPALLQWRISFPRFAARAVEGVLVSAGAVIHPPSKLPVAFSKKISMAVPRRPLEKDNGRVARALGASRAPISFRFAGLSWMRRKARRLVRNRAGPGTPRRNRTPPPRCGGLRSSPPRKLGPGPPPKREYTTFQAGASATGRRRARARAGGGLFDRTGSGSTKP